MKNGTSVSSQIPLSNVVFPCGLILATRTTQTQSQTTEADFESNHKLEIAEVNAYRPLSAGLGYRGSKRCRDVRLPFEHELASCVK